MAFALPGDGFHVLGLALDYVTSIWHELGTFQNCALTTLSKALRGTASSGNCAPEKAGAAPFGTGGSRCKRATRERDDARGVEHAGDPARHLAERSQLRQAEQPCVRRPGVAGRGQSEAERRASSDVPGANLAERSHWGLAERGRRKLAERSQRETFALKPHRHAILAERSQWRRLARLSREVQRRPRFQHQPRAPPAAATRRRIRSCGGAGSALIMLLSRWEAEQAAVMAKRTRRNYHAPNSLMRNQTRKKGGQHEIS
jgi:hypothetical protein